MLGDDPVEFEGPAHFHACCGGGTGFLLLLLLIAIGILVCGLVAGAMWQRNERDRQDRRVADDIYDALYLRGLGAAAVTGTGLIQAAETLRQDIIERLGPLARFGGPLSKNLDALEKAVKSTSADPKSGKESGGLSILGGSVAVGPAPAASSASSPVDAARLAIGAFNDFWGKRRDRVEEIREMQRVLSHTAPFPRIVLRTVPVGYVEAAPRPLPGEGTVVATVEKK